MGKNDLLEIDSPLINVALYFVLATMGGVGLLSLQAAWKAFVALALLLSLAILLAPPVQGKLTQRWFHFQLFAQVGLIGGLLLLGPNNNGFGFLLFIPATQAAVALPPARSLRWMAFPFLVLAVHSLLAWGRSGIINVLFNAGGYVFVAAFGYAVRQAELARRRSQALLQELQAAQQQLQALAVTEERNRLAREMHDSLGHCLTVAVVQLEGAQRLIPRDPERAGSMIMAMREQLKEALAELRRTVAALRTDELPFDIALHNLTTNFHESTGMLVHLKLPAELPVLPDEHRLAFYRAAQEALTNAQRHAAASQVWLNIWVEESSIVLTARDDGKRAVEPAGAVQSGFGLHGLRERAEQLGGDFQFDLPPGQGAQLTFRLPLPG